MEPSPDWKEEIGPDEEQRFEALAAVLGRLQTQNAAKREKKSRALHAKPTAGVRAPVAPLIRKADTVLPLPLLANSTF